MDFVNARERFVADFWGYVEALRNSCSNDLYERQKREKKTIGREFVVYNLECKLGSPPGAGKYNLSISFLHDSS